MWTAGHPQLVVYPPTSARLWSWHGFGSIGRRFLSRGDDCCTGASRRRSVSRLPLLSSAAEELGAVSRRAERSWNLYTAMALPPSQLMTLVLPMSFGGFSPRPGVVVPYAGVASLVEMGGTPGCFHWLSRSSR